MFFENPFFLENNNFNYLLKEDAKPKIKKYRELDKEEEKNDCCPISLNAFSPDSDIALLICGHYFEPEALNTWLNQQQKTATPMSCPLCRTTLKVSKKRAIQTFVRKLLLAEEKLIQEKIYSTLFYENNNDTEEDTNVDTDTLI